MFRPMRRAAQALTHAECEEILRRAACGVLACLGDDGYPYTVPLNFVYHEGKLYFHGAKTGHKIDAITGCDKVSFCVIDRDDVVSQENTTYFRSVIVFGKARLLCQEEEKHCFLQKLAGKFAPLGEAAAEKEILQSRERTAVIELCVEHLSGKEAIELKRTKGK